MSNGQCAKPPSPWREENGVIFFTLTSNGMTGEKWITYLKTKKTPISPDAISYNTEQLLRSPEFKTTDGVTYEVVVLKGKLFKDLERSTENIDAEAAKRSLEKPSSLELAFLIYDAFTCKDREAMGLDEIIIMSKPFVDSVGSLRLLGAIRKDYAQWVAALYGNPARQWYRVTGFAYVSRKPACNTAKA